GTRLQVSFALPIPSAASLPSVELFLELSDLIHNDGDHQVVASPDQCLRDPSLSPPHLFVFSISDIDVRFHAPRSPRQPPVASLKLHSSP
ncbi:unnamed protein product, partial [Brassica oleracea]